MALARASGAYKSTHRELCKLVADSRSVASDFEVKEEDSWLANCSDRDQNQDENSRLGRFEGSKIVTESQAMIKTTRQLSEVEERARRLESALNDSQAARDAAVKRLTMLEENNERLRQLVQETLRSGDQYKHKMKRAESFFDSLGGSVEQTEALLQFSEPPSSFEAYKVEPAHATELETTKARLKQSQLEVERLRNRVEALTRKASARKAQRRDRLREAEQLVASKHTQVLGAVRRVQYLLEQNERQQNDISKKDTYIARLEEKLLEMNRDLNNLRAREKPRAPLPIESNGPVFGRSSKRSAAKTRVQEMSSTGSLNDVATGVDELKVNWQSVFEQGSLGKSPSPVQRQKQDKEQERVLSPPTCNEKRQTHTRLAPTRRSLSPSAQATLNNVVLESERRVPMPRSRTESIDSTDFSDTLSGLQDEESIIGGTPTGGSFALGHSSDEELLDHQWVGGGLRSPN